MKSVMDQIQMLFWIWTFIFCGYTTAQTGRVVSVTYDVNIDGSIILLCHTYFQGRASKIDRSWILHGKILVKNTEIFAIDPLRYGVGYQNNGKTYVYILTIQNLVQTDAGMYQCRIDYTQNGINYSNSKAVDVGIDSYLPPLNYPLCSIKPFQTLSNGNLAEFKCEVGETTAQITLKLTLKIDDGSIIDLGDSMATRYLSVRKTVTLGDNNSMFICQMTSETFPTAYRNCSAGRLIIYEEESYIKEMSNQSTISMPTGPTTQTHQNGSKVLISSIVGSASGLLILSLLVIIGVACRGQTHRNTLPSVDSTYTSYQADSAPEPYALLNQPGESNKGIMTLPIPEYQNIHVAHTTQMHLSTETSPNKALPTVDSTNMSYQTDSYQEPYVLLNQTGDAHTRTMTSPSPKYQNIHVAHTKKVHLMPISSNQASPTVDSTKMPHHTDSYQEPYALLNQTGDSHKGSTTLSHPEYQNI